MKRIIKIVLVLIIIISPTPAVHAGKKNTYYKKSVDDKVQLEHRALIKNNQCNTSVMHDDEDDDGNPACERCIGRSIIIGVIGIMMIAIPQIIKTYLTTINEYINRITQP